MLNTTGWQVEEGAGSKVLKNHTWSAFFEDEQSERIRNRVTR